MFHSVGDFIKCKSKEMKVSAKVLASGLCSSSYLSKVQNGELDVDKFFFDALLQRLGVSEEFFEHYITDEVYAMQSLRMDLLRAIERHDISGAEHLLNEYEKVADMNSILHKQFGEYARILMIKSNNSNHKEISELYLQVILMTVPQFGSVLLKDLLLSATEIWIILEYAEVLCHGKEADAIQVYAQLIQYLQKPNIEDNIKAKIYPRVIYLLSQIWINDHKMYRATLNLCNKGIEFLRAEFRLDYLIDLLKLKIQLSAKLNIMDEEYDRAKKWYETLEFLYREYHISENAKKVCESYYQYFSWQNYYIIGDVVKRRRKILGLSQDELAGDDCDVKTISRLENHTGTTQPKNAKIVLEKLNLTGERYSDNITYHEYETFKLSRDTTHDISLHRFEQGKEKLELLKQKLELSNRVNKQYVEHKEIVLAEQFGEISAEQALNKLKETLELTLPIEGIFKTKERHFTKKEISIINGITEHHEKLKQFSEMKKWVGVMEEYYADPTFYKNHFTYYLFSIDTIQSIYGNEMNFKHSNELVHKLILECFEFGKFTFLGGLIHSVAWNFKTEIALTREVNTKEKERYMKLLEFSYILYDLKDDEFMKRFVLGELNE